MPSVESNISRLDREAESFTTKVGSIIDRAISDLEDSVEEREVRSALRAAEILAQLDQTILSDLSRTVDRLTTLYGEVLADIREEFKDSGFEFEFTEGDEAAAVELIEFDVGTLREHITSFTQSVKSDLARASFASSLKDIDIRGVVEPQRDRLLNTLRSELINGIQGFRNAVTAKTAKDSNTRLKYVGPLDDKTREFCAEHVGKVYTIDEILDLDNGQGLPVLTNMGGYNCRHEWRPVK